MTRRRRTAAPPGRLVFNVVRALAYATESRGVAFYACAAEHVLATEGVGGPYVRELRHLVWAIGVELELHVGQAVEADQRDAGSVVGNACDVRLFAEALSLLAGELERAASTAAPADGPTP